MITETNSSEDAAPEDLEAICRGEDGFEEQAGSTDHSGVKGLDPREGQHQTPIPERRQLTAYKHYYSISFYQLI